MELDNQSVDEQKLIAGCIKGERWAQKALYEMYAPVLMSVCVRYVGDYETARDVLQDGFIKLFTKIEMFSGTGSFAGWVRRIFVTTALEFLRKNDALKQSININDMNEFVENQEVTVLEEISANELMKIILELPDGYRTVFNLYVLEGFSHAEIAGMLNITENTSRSQFMRARKLLQQKVHKLLE
jgi:RNA polymerase sigma-70 factor (ECF subfamily)